MPGDHIGRRRFLKATSGAATTIAVAGCTSGDGGTDGTQTNGGEPTSTSTGGTGTSGGTSTSGGSAVSLDAYPYSINETGVGKAKQVMEEAGYGSNNRFSLNWLQYKSPTWKEMAKTIRSRLQQAHIDMSISSATFSSLLSKTKKGKHEAFTLGWIADYPAPKNFLQLIDPPNTIYGQDGPTPNGARLMWTEDAKADPAIRQFMVKQFDRVQDNPQDTKEARQIRQDAAKKMEEGMWKSACLLPVYHSLSEVFWYDNVDYQPYGGMGGSRAKTSTSVKSISGKNRVSLTESTFSTLDPIASGNTASGDVIMDIFDAPMNYVNGTTEVKGLLVENYQVSDDLTTYTFKLKEGVQFQGDFGEVKAADVVYSIRRLVESPNSTNTYFPLSVMSIEHETETTTVTVTDTAGNETTKEKESVVPESTGVEATGEYTFKVHLQKPFAYALPVLAYGAFSIVPEGIVGDIKGYEGEMDYSTFATSNPVGAGPFTFKNWESGSGGEVTLDTFEDYHGSVPSYNGVDRAIITDPTAGFNYFVNQNSDVDGIPTSKYNPNKVSVEKTDESGRQIGTYGPLKNDKTVNYAGVPTIDTFYIGFNLQKVPPAVRKAMGYVINHQQFVQEVFKGRGEPAFHLEPPQVFPGGPEGYDKHYQQSN